MKIIKIITIINTCMLIVFNSAFAKKYESEKVTLQEVESAYNSNKNFLKFAMKLEEITKDNQEYLCPIIKKAILLSGTENKRRIIEIAHSAFEADPDKIALIYDCVVSVVDKNMNITFSEIMKGNENPDDPTVDDVTVIGNVPGDIPSTTTTASETETSTVVETTSVAIRATVESPSSINNTTTVEAAAAAIVSPTADPTTTDPDVDPTTPDGTN